MSTASLALQNIDHDPAEPLARPGTGALRLLIGLVQGLLLYLLYSAAQDQRWPATVPMLFLPLLLLAVTLPVLVVASIGHLAPRRLALWAGSAAVVVAALGAHDGWRRALDGGGHALGRASAPSPLLCLHLVVALFIVHTLIAAASAERRRVASYPAYFDAAWKLAVQLVFSAGFTVAAWLVLNLGGELFKLIKLDFLHALLGKAWFNIPAMAFAFTCAMHVTDVRPAIVRGIRGLLLVLMSWLLPVVTLLTGGFLASLLATGLAPLWATRHAAAVLLVAAALLVLMINAAWQNGEGFAAVAAPIRWSARLAALLLTPLVGVAAWALALRVGNHGWTDDRIVAAATTVVAACYALGYLAAAIESASLRRLARVNIATAVVIVAVIVALFSPLFDPARLSVNSQLARLETGKVAAAKFDYAYLAGHGERYGREALAALSRRTGGADAAVIRGGAASALKAQSESPRPPTARQLAAPQLAANLTVWPAGASVPAELVNAPLAGTDAWRLPACLTMEGRRCDVFVIDGVGGQADYLVIGAEPGSGAVLLHKSEARGWRMAATLPPQLAGCASLRQQLIEGKLRSAAPAVPALVIGEQVIQPRPVEEPPLACPN